MTADMSRVRFCVCGRPGFEYSDGVFRCLVGHEISEPVEAGDAA